MRRTRHGRAHVLWLAVGIRQQGFEHVRLFCARRANGAASASGIGDERQEATVAAVRAGHAAPVAGGDPMRFVSLVRGGRTWGEVGARASVWSEVGATLLNFAQLCTTLLKFANLPTANTQLTQFSPAGLLGLQPALPNAQAP